MRTTGKKLGEAIKKKREELGFSQKTLAEKARVSEDSITRLEKGTHKSHQATLDSVFEVLGTSEEILLEYNIKKTSPEDELMSLIKAWKNASELKRRFAMACLRGEKVPENKETKSTSSGEESD